VSVYRDQPHGDNRGGAQLRRDDKASAVRTNVGKMKSGVKSPETPPKDDKKSVVKVNVGLHDKA
jgi:hypothetical protein